VHVLDASRAVPVATTLLSLECRGAFIERHRAEYEELRRLHTSSKRALLPIEVARQQPTPITWKKEDLSTPEFVGVRVLKNVSLAALREWIDWTPFFHTWELRGVYPRIFEHEKYGEQARQLYAEANQLLDRIVAEKRLTAHGIYGIFPANATGDDVQLYT